MHMQYHIILLRCEYEYFSHSIMKVQRYPFEIVYMYNALDNKQHLLYMKISINLLIHVDLCHIILDKKLKRGNIVKQNKFGTSYLTEIMNIMI